MATVTKTSVIDFLNFGVNFCPSRSKEALTNATNQHFYIQPRDIESLQAFQQASVEKRADKYKNPWRSRASSSHNSRTAPFQTMSLVLVPAHDIVRLEKPGHKAYWMELLANVDAENVHQRIAIYQARTMKSTPTLHRCGRRLTIFTVRIQCA